MHMTTESSSNTSPAPSAPAVTARGLKKTFGAGDTTVHALDNVTVNFPAGEFTAIMGPSGSGKSTLMHSLAGLDTVDSGKIQVGDVEITGMNDDQLTKLRRERIGFIFQAFNLVPTLTAAQNILLPLELAGKKPDQEWMDEIVRILGLGERLKHKPHQLSGGQQQRVAVARALLTRPDVVFADEPTGALDSATGAEVLSLLRRCAREMGQTIIMVTHDPSAAAYANRVLLLADGQLQGEIQSPTAENVLAALSELGVK